MLIFCERKKHTSLEEEGLEERPEFLRTDCSEYVCKTQTISLVKKKETKRDLTFFFFVMTKTYNVVRVDKFSIEGGNVPLRLLDDISLHKNIRSQNNP